jgi:hypothetical protein
MAGLNGRPGLSQDEAGGAGHDRAAPRRTGSRIGVFLFDEVRVFHRPHPSPDTDKSAVASNRKWQEQSERRREHVAELNKRAAERELRLKRL